MTPQPTTPPPAPAAHEAAANWHLLDATTDGVPGISLERAQRELLAGKTPRRTVLVAVIDGGVDTAHVDLRANLWLNPKETAGNNRDDDGNGYVDDVYGWNFIGGRDGKSVRWDTFEVTRLYALCQKNAPEVRTLPCDSIKTSYEERKSEAQQTLTQINMIAPAFERATSMLKQALGTPSLTLAQVQAYRPTDPQLRQAKAIYEQLTENGITPEVIAEAREEKESELRYGLDVNFDPRAIVGDNYANLTERLYGNRDVMGPDSDHGTHVAGIIGSVRGNNVGTDGITSAVRLMAVRAAAGNDGEDLSTNRNYPTPYLNDRTRASTWIEVGASSWKGGDTLAAAFSNYGREQVDVFAPGEDILSTKPGGGTKRASGTSMAAPVVSGLAALIMAYYPELTAADVKRIIIESATRMPDRMTLQPGSDSGTKVPFGSLSATGGIVNAYNALRLAEQAVKRSN
jgi:subtilisin family serine protease